MRKYPTIKRQCLILFLSLIISACVNTRHKNSAEEIRKDASVQLQLGLEYLKSGQNNVALGRIENAIDIDPGYSQAYNVLALLYERIGETEKAIEAFERSIELDPENSSALNNYGRHACTSKQYQKAIELFQKAAAKPLYMTKWLPLTNAGLCALKQRQPRFAETKFREALRLRPKFAPALLEMAKIQFNNKNYLGTRAYIQRYTEISPHSPRTLWLGIRTERILGDKNALASYSLNLRNNFSNSKEAGFLLEKNNDIYKRQ